MKKNDSTQKYVRNAKYIDEIAQYYQLDISNNNVAWKWETHFQIYHRGEVEISRRWWWWWSKLLLDQPNWIVWHFYEYCAISINILSELFAIEYDCFIASIRLNGRLHVHAVCTTCVCVCLTFFFENWNNHKTKESPLQRLDVLHCKVHSFVFLLSYHSVCLSNFNPTLFYTH